MSNNQLLDTQFLYQIEKLAVINKRIKKGLYSGKRKSKNQGSSVEFADYRSYTPGDDYRLIDWNTYARHEKLFLKTYYDEQELNVSIYIDSSKSMDFGKPGKFHTAVKIAAALAYLSLNNYDRVSVYSFDNMISQALPLLTGKGKVHQLFNFLNGLKPGNEGNLNQALANGSATHGRPGISIIISDFLFEEGYEKGIGYIQAANQEVILVQLLSTEENEPYLEGDLRLVDSEYGSKREISVTPYLLKKYHTALKDYKKKLAEFAHKRGITYVNIDAETSIEQIIFNVFKRSGLLR